jgi:3-hydroxy-3-methylglutaryl CoA synthase
MNYDEDALTMGQAAAWPLHSMDPDTVYFASTTAPYWQRSAASLIAACCDLPAKVAAADFGASLRCGAAALRSAFDAVTAGSGKTALVVASDARVGAPESGEEMVFGDAAAAIAVSGDRVIAELIASSSRSDDFMDEWRRDTDTYVRSFPSKYSATRGYEANVTALGRTLFERGGVRATDIARAALVSPDGRAHLTIAKSLGIDPDHVEDPRVAELGMTGAAMPLFLLARALDQSKPGDLILAIAYGDGADGFLLRVTDEIAKVRRPSIQPESRTIEYRSYPIYRKLREALRTGTAPEMSNVLWEREEPQNIRLHGTFCPKCGTMQFPVTRVCVSCHNSCGLIEKPLARKGKVFTFTKDFLYDAPVQPTVMAVVDLDGSGRFLCQMTDVEESAVEIGMPVEMVLRRMREGAGLHHYYWKCRPL